MTQSAGDLARAQALFEEGLEVDRELGEVWGAATLQLNLGTLAVEQGEPDRAEALLLDVLGTFRQLGDMEDVAECLQSLAGVSGARGETGRAATLFGAAEAAREELGTPMPPVERARYERFVALSKRCLDEESWAAAWAAGRAISLQEATEYVLSSDAGSPAISRDTPPAQPERRRPSVPLTRREEEVALLAARGLTNRRIAEELSISEHTAATHVRRVLRKLGLGSRGQLAAWTAEQRRSPSDVGDRKVR